MRKPKPARDPLGKAFGRETNASKRTSFSFATQWLKGIRSGKPFTVGCGTVAVNAVTLNHKFCHSFIGERHVRWMSGERSDLAGFSLKVA